MGTDGTADPAIVGIVTEVTNRFGVDGLDTLIALAAEHRVEAESALEALADAVPPW